MPSALRGKVLLAFITVSIAWGTTYAGMRVAVTGFRPLQLAGLRFLLAGVVLMLVLRLAGYAFPRRADWIRVAIPGLALLTVCNVLLCWGEQFIPSTLASLLVNIGPLIYIALARCFGERVAPRAWIGMAVGFMGVGVLMAPQLIELFTQANHFSVPHFWPAVGGVLLAPLVWSSGSLYTSRHPAQCNPLMAAAAQNVAGGVGALLLAALFHEYTSLATVSFWAWFAFAYLVVVGSWLGYVSYIYCVAHLPSAKVAVTVYLNTITAVLTGTIILGESLNWAMIAGGIILLIGVAIVQSARAPHLPAAENNPHDEA